jgi:cystathionine beta-lyase
VLYDFDQILNRKHTNSVKWEFMSLLNDKVDADALPFWIADMDFAPPPAMIEAIKKRTDQLVLGYSMADDTYYRAVITWFEERFTWCIAPQNIFISSGVVPAIKELLLALSAPGDGVIIQRPVYYPFSILIEKTGRRVVNNALVNTDGRYTIDFQDLENKVRDPATTMMLFCSPHNPVGRVWSREELEQVGRICLEHDVLLVSDEIHCDLLRAGVRHFPLTTLFPDNDTIITCTSPSKTFNCAGMQIANIIIENKILQEKWTDMVGPELPSPLALAAVRGAYEGGGAWLQQLRKYLDDNVLFLQHFLRTELPETRFTVPEGTYLAWIDFSSYGYSNRELSDLLVTGARVLLEDGLMFGSEGNGFQRMNIACPRSILKTGLQQMAATLHPG